MLSNINNNTFTNRTQKIQKVKELEEEIEKKEEMDVESTNLPKGVLPADFFDDHVEGAVAMGMKRKEAEKQLKEYFVFSFNNS